MSGRLASTFVLVAALAAPVLGQSLGEPTEIPSDKKGEALRREKITDLADRSRVDLPGAVDPDVYRVGPNDVFQLTIYGGISRTEFFEVGPEGTVILPSVGSLKVDGLTLSVARNEILAKLRPEFRGLSLELRLARPRTFRVYVTGQVGAPGSLDASGATRVSDLIALVKPEDNAGLRNIEIVHRDRTREIADLERFNRTGDQSLNPFLRDGDVVHVPVASRSVSVQGALSRPGRYELGPRDSLRTLLSLAGGTIPAADSQRVLFTRWLDAARTDSTWTDLGSIDAGRFNPALQNGDRVYVYFIPQYQVQNEVTVLGHVQRPGIYPIRVGRDRISDVIRSAGGFLPGADLGSISVRRATESPTPDDPELQRLLQLSRQELTEAEYSVLRTRLAGQRETYRVDWNQLLQVGPSLDILLVGGDIIDVERLVNSIRVDGEVRRPGIVEYRPGMTALDYIDKAGGYSKRAWKSKVRVTRSVTGQTLLAKDVAILDPGDFIWVPERPETTAWQQATILLVAVGQIATIILAIDAISDNVK